MYGEKGNAVVVPSTSSNRIYWVWLKSRLWIGAFLHRFNARRPQLARPEPNAGFASCYKGAVSAMKYQYQQHQIQQQ
ncbi:hypothetical protein PS880_00778 [Pseudomonas fluorescens]|uniref:Uncharacterized protein n=1 Tax=Pseudomonas fluorescens TaxID=294 RepID=A0A5E7HJ67_PSEFL|nr:hypothetical protein PS880_00778 [Pseudomonas fluorescens]